MEQPAKPCPWAAVSQPLRVAYFVSGETLTKSCSGRGQVWGMGRVRCTALRLGACHSMAEFFKHMMFFGTGRCACDNMSFWMISTHFGMHAINQACGMVMGPVPGLTSGRLRPLRTHTHTQSSTHDTHCTSTHINCTTFRRSIMSLM